MATVLMKCPRWSFSCLYGLTKPSTRNLPVRRRAARAGPDLGGPWFPAPRLPGSCMASGPTKVRAAPTTRTSGYVRLARGRKAPARARWTSASMACWPAADGCVWSGAGNVSSAAVEPSGPLTPSRRPRRRRRTPRQWCTDCWSARQWRRRGRGCHRVHGRRPPVPAGPAPSPRRLRWRRHPRPSEGAARWSPRQ